MTIETASVTVAFVDPPKVGKSGRAGPAHMKDAAGVRYDFWPRTIPLETFVRGGTYQIGFETKQNGEYTNREIKQVFETQQRPVAMPPKPQRKPFRYSMD